MRRKKEVKMEKRTYNEIILEIQETLNKKGRGVKGFNRQAEVLKLLKELKESYNITLSTFFLRGLLNNSDERKKTFALRNLLSGVEKHRTIKYSKSLGFSKKKRDILLYAYLKNLEYKTTYKPIVVNCELEPIEHSQIEIGKELVSYNVILKDSHSEQIGKEAICRKQKVYKFLLE
jgi:hypothetical protein